MKLSIKFIKQTTMAVLFFSPILFCYNCSALTGQSGNLTAGQLPDRYIQNFAPNSINIWNPCENVKRNVSGGGCGEDVTGSTAEERLREVVEKYGIFFMNAQIEFGVPWEIPIIHSHLESHFGLDKPSVAYDTEKCGYYNWSGYKYGNYALFGLSESEMNGCLAWHSDGGFGSQYKNLADMYMSYYTDYLRNGAYDAAFEYATPTNFDPRKFLEAETDGIYCASGCGSGYVSQYDYDIDTIHKIAAEKGWPTSEELMKEYKIPKGGNWSDTWGDIKDHIDAEPHSLSVDCSSMTTLGDVSGINLRGGTLFSSSSSKSSSSNSSSDSSVSGDQITWIGDSYSCGALPIIKQKFSGISFGGSECDANSYIMSNKGVSDRYGGGTENPPALTILQRIADAGELKPYLVMAIGTNAGWDDTEVNKFKEIMSSHQDTKVVFVNVKAKAHLGADDINTNQRLKNLVDSNDNYYLADWAAAYDDKYFANNSTHPDANGGYDKWVEVIANALNNMTDDCATYEGDYPQYFQSAEPWGSVGYPSGSSNTIGSSGCGAASMAMLATVATGKDIYPQDVAELTMDSPYYGTGGSGMTDLDKKVCEKYGCEVENVSWSGYDDAINKIKQYLNEDWMIHLSGQGSAPFSDVGHYIGIFKLNGDKVMVANSAGEGNKEWDLHDLVHAGMHYDFSAIKGSGSSNKCKDNDSVCSVGGDGNNGTGTISTGGLTEPQAEKLAEYYNNGGGSDCASGTRENCYNLSMWWLCNFTDVVEPPTNACSGVGTGAEVVDCLESRYNLKTGTEPRPYAIFSTTSFHGTIHTGVVVAVNDSGEIMTIEAAYGGWSDLSNGLARVWPFQSIEGHSINFAYLDDRVDIEKLKEAIGN